METIYIKNKPIAFYKECLKIENYKIKNYEEINATNCNFVIETMPLVNYEDEVNKRVREKYSLSQELSLLRQKESKVDEYQVYYDYVESCKNQAKEKLKEYEEWKNS